VERIHHLVVEDGQMADDLSSGLDGVAGRAGFLLEVEERVPAGAGEEGGGQEGGGVVGEDRDGTVTPGVGLSGPVDSVVGGVDVLHVPGTGDGGLGGRGRLVAAAETVQEVAEEDVGRTGGVTIVIALHGIQLPCEVGPGVRYELTPRPFSRSGAGRSGPASNCVQRLRPTPVDPDRGYGWVQVLPGPEVLLSRRRDEDRVSGCEGILWEGESVGQALSAGNLEEV